MKTTEEVALKYGIIKGFSILSDTELIESSLYNAMQEYAELYYEDKVKDDLKKAFEDGSQVASWSDMGITMKYEKFDDWFKKKYAL